MELSKVLLWVMVGIIVFFVIIGLFYWFGQPQSASVDPTAYTNQYIPFGFWGESTSGSDASRNQCRLYQFSAGTDTSGTSVCGQHRGVPAQPSLDPAVIDQLPPMTAGGCYDLDQIVAVQVEHTCISTDDLEAGDFTGVNAEGQVGISFCTGFDGKTVPIGSSEDYYAQSATVVNPSGDTTSFSCSTQSCAGNLALYGFNYKTSTYSTSNNTQTPIQPVCPGNNSFGYGMRCLRTDGAGNFTTAVCDISDRNQLFRVTQTDQGVPPPSTGSSNGKTGRLAQIYSRVDQSCLTSDASGSELLLGQCNAVWALVPFVGGSTSNAVQQTLYVGNLTQDQVQSLVNDANPDSLIDAIQSLGLNSLQMTGDGSVKLLPYATYSISEFNDNVWMPSSQIISYVLYNSILFTTNQYTFPS